IRTLRFSSEPLDIGFVATREQLLIQRVANAHDFDFDTFRPQFCRVVVNLNASLRWNGVTVRCSDREGEVRLYSVSSCGKERPYCLIGREREESAASHAHRRVAFLQV